MTRVKNLETSLHGYHCVAGVMLSAACLCHNAACDLGVFIKFIMSRNVRSLIFIKCDGSLSKQEVSFCFTYVGIFLIWQGELPSNRINHVVTVVERTLCHCHHADKKLYNLRLETVQSSLNPMQHRYKLA